MAVMIIVSKVCKTRVVTLIIDTRKIQWTRVWALGVNMMETGR